MTNKRNKSGIYGKAIKFIELRDWLNKTFTMGAYDDPKSSISLVDDKTLAISSPMHIARFVYIAPFVLAFWCVFFSIGSSMWPSEENIEFARDMARINQESRERGELVEEHLLYFEALLGEDGKSSPINYTTAIMNYGSGSMKEWLYEDFIILGFMFIISLTATILFLRIPRMADLYFDRQRQIVYTWRNGKVAACHFDNLGYRETVYGLDLFLYREHKKKQYWPTRVTVQPTGRVHFNREDDSTAFMVQLFNFMDKGKSAVITGDRFERKPARFYLRVDKKPENFEQRVAEILKRDHELPELYTKHLI
ncbi:hypothetical protein C1141_17105 [Vibrio agarivorans]|nr:hypothetical protein C1141_17105 [Vibrio agarivorans]